MKWSLSYKSIVKFSLYNSYDSLITPSIPMDPKHSIVKGLDSTNYIYIYPHFSGDD